MVISAKRCDFFRVKIQPLEGPISEVYQPITVSIDSVILRLNYWSSMEKDNSRFMLSEREKCKETFTEIYYHVTVESLYNYLIITQIWI